MVVVMVETVVVMVEAEEEVVVVYLMVELLPPEELKPAPYGSATARTEATSKAVTAAVGVATSSTHA